MRRKVSRTRSVIAALWRWSWLVTLPVAIFFYLWAFNTASAYYKFEVAYRPLVPKHLSTIGANHARDLLAYLNRVATPSWKYNAKGLDRMHLYVSEANLKNLSDGLPHVTGEYVNSALLYPDGKLHKVKMRYRGDMTSHWAGRKKSIRIKTRKSMLYKGLRAFNLITFKSSRRPMDDLAYLLAERLNLLAPESKMVELYINGKYSGVYLFLEQLGEQFLRRNSLMPGDLFVGEIIGRDQYVEGTYGLFSNSELWTKAAINNHNPPEWKEPLKRLTYAIYNEEMDELLELLDLDSWATFAAYITLCQTLHYDRDHNWKIYFDPAMGHFIPVVWDPAGWVKGFVEKISQQRNRMDIITSIIFDRLHRDQRFLAAKHAAMESFFTSGGDLYLRDAQEYTERLEASLRLEGNINFKKMLNDLEQMRKRIAEVLDDVKKAYMEEPPSAAYSVDTASEAVQINLDGFTPIKFLEIDYASAAAISADGLAVNISFEVDGEVRSKRITSGVSTVGNTLRLEVPLFSRRVMLQTPVKGSIILKDAVLRPASYRVKVSGRDGLSVAGIRAGYGAGKTVALERVDSLETYPLDGNYHVLDTIDEPVKSIVWSGERVIKGVTEIDDNLKISPGTKIRFGAGASLIVSGRLKVEGTEERPVSFVPVKDGQKPWGAVVLKGAGANGSRISHAEFRGGSGLTRDYVEFSAMLSIHGVKDVEILNSAFSDNAIVDDMVHAVYSKILIKDSVFRGALLDALDLDYVEGVVEGTRFFGSGNDALDLMSSKVTVLSSRMEGSGDKGISVGEGAEVFIWNSSISGNAIGLQAKDRSEAVLYNSELLGNHKTIDAYKKNWQYGSGGHVRIFKSNIVGAAPTLTSDRDSTIKVYDSYFSGTAGKRRKQIELGPVVDSKAGYERRARSSDSFANLIELSESFSQGLGRIEPEIRGMVEADR